MTQRAVLYPRVSTAHQKDGCALDDQERDMRKHAAAQGYEVVAVVPDTHTGHNSLNERPGLQRVRALFRNHEADVLVVWRFDRAARDMTDDLLLLREVSGNGGRLESATEGRIENTPLGRTMLALHGFASETEREAIIQRTHSAIRTRAENGRLLVGYGPKFGYVYSDDKKSTYVIDERTGAVVRRIFRMALDGAGLRVIARTLNDEHVPTPSASRGARRAAAFWRRGALWRILTDESYTGRHVVYRRTLQESTVTGKRAYAPRDEADTRRIEHAIPALVTVAEWQQVQASLRGRMLGVRETATVEEQTLLTRGFAFCGHCGGPMISNKANGRRHYRCGRSRHAVDNAAHACPAGYFSVPAKVTDDEVRAAIADIAADTPRLAKLIADKRTRMTARMREVEESTTITAAEMKETREQMQNLVRSIATTRDANVAALLDAELSRLTTHAKQLEERLGKSDMAMRFLAAVYDAFQEANAAISTAHSVALLTRAQMRGVLQSLGVRVLMYARKSDYTRQHDGRRWNMVFSEESVLSPLIP
jgi:DNA invertase Pin-like site-specific DNA recombinase